MEIIKLKDGSKIRIRPEDMTPNHKSAVVTETVEVKKDTAPKEKVKPTEKVEVKETDTVEKE